LQTLSTACHFRIFLPMKSRTINTFPQFVFEGDEKLLFNPVLKKRLKNRPEERVRLRWVEYLLQGKHWPKARIGFETPVKLYQEPNTLRADLILHDRDLKPQILIECKAPSVALNEKAAAQAARYNMALNAELICLTNGLTDFWFKSDGSQVPEKELLFPESDKALHDPDEGWWIDRGFYSEAAEPNLNTRMKKILYHFWFEIEDWDTRYLDFQHTPGSNPISHYYRIAAFDSEQKLAVSFIGRPGHAPVLAAVLNRSGKNEGLLTINLPKLMKREPASAHLYHGRIEKRIDAHKHLPLFTEAFNPAVIENLPVFLMKFFE
jgi:hypothetical protein